MQFHADANQNTERLQPRTFSRFVPLGRQFAARDRRQQNTSECKSPPPDIPRVMEIAKKLGLEFLPPTGA